MLIAQKIRHIISCFSKMVLTFKISPYFKGKNGIEIGGPSSLFSYGLPLYKMISKLDGCNFSKHTVWEGEIAEGNSYNYYKNKTGFQYISEAYDLKAIASEHYDFLLASHCLEHCANCIKTLQEWLRVLKPGGSMLLILPDKRFTFDHKREVTTFNHLVDDFVRDINETDLTHLDEILSLHDLSMDTLAGDLKNFKQRSLSNFRNRCLHHHVFDFDLLIEISKHLKIDVKFKKWIAPYHQIIIAQKPLSSKNQLPDT